MGKYSKRLGKRVINTCPIDGPLRWLVNCAYFVENFRDLLLQEIFIFGEIHSFYKHKKAVDGRLLWDKTDGGGAPKLEKEMKLIYLEVKQNSFLR